MTAARYTELMRDPFLLNIPADGIQSVADSWSVGFRTKATAFRTNQSASREMGPPNCA